MPVAEVSEPFAVPARGSAMANLAPGTLNGMMAFVPGQPNPPPPPPKTSSRKKRTATEDLAAEEQPDKNVKRRKLRVAEVMEEKKMSAYRWFREAGAQVIKDHKVRADELEYDFLKCEKSFKLIDLILREWGLTWEIDGCPVKKVFYDHHVYRPEAEIKAQAVMIWGVKVDEVTEHGLHDISVYGYDATAGTLAIDLKYVRCVFKI